MGTDTVRSQAEYRSAATEILGLPLFSQPWWLDAAAGLDAWDCVLAYRGGELVGTLPYVEKKRSGLTLITQPPLTQTLGPFLRPFSGRLSAVMAYEKEVLGALADGLPPFDIYRQDWNPAADNWLPFYWRGFQQTTRYTYQLKTSSGPEALWDGFASNIRTDIRKAKSRHNVTVRRTDDVSEFLELNRLVFERQGKKLPYLEDLILRIDAAASEQKGREILIAEGEDGRPHAGAYIVHDATHAYYLMGGSDPDLRNSGAGSLCLWEAILSQAARGTTFDFEGSMIEPIERYFRAFGSRRTPYFSVSKSASVRGALAALAHHAWHHRRGGPG